MPIIVTLAEPVSELTGPPDEPTAIMLLSGLSIKGPSKFLSLCSEITAALHDF